MQTLKTLVAGTALALASIAAFAAEDANKGGPVRAACRADVQKLCPNVQPGGGRIAQCLRENHDAVSEPCKGALKEARRERRHISPLSPPKVSG